MNTIEAVAYEVELLTDEPRCESEHVATGNKVCSVLVTHAVRWCQGTSLICENATRAALARRKWCRCVECHEFASDCWRIYPI